MGCACSSSKPSQVHEPIRKEAPTKATHKEAHPSLGVIRCDYQYEAPPGDVACPASFKYEVHYKVIAGMGWDMLGSGKLTPAVKENLVNGIKHLESKGVCAIAGDCGMMYQFQQVARKATKLPVLLSSFYQCPLLQTLVSADEKILILTAWKEAESAAQAILTGAGFVGDRNRFVFDAFADLAGVEFVAVGGTFEYEKFAPALVERAKKNIAENPSIRAIVFECTEMPPYADVMRYETGLPVYDAVTLCDFVMSSRIDNPFNEYGSWHHIPKESRKYFWGENLTQSEKAQVVSKAPPKEKADATLGMPKAADHPEQTKQAPVLGVILLDGEKEASYAGSFGYEVRCKSVPGLTLEMCKTGNMTDTVQTAFTKVIDQFQTDGVRAITGDCSFMLHFQSTGIVAAKVPVFLSPILMYPMLQSFFEDNEKILIVALDASKEIPMSEVFQQCGLPEGGVKKYEMIDLSGIRQAQAIKNGALLEKPQEFISALVKRLRERMSKQQSLRAILLESEKLTPFSDQLRHQLKIPVFDMINLCDYVLSGFKDNPRFGIDYEAKTNGA